ncbi:MAG: thioredoxin reductase (NADPH) [Flammeovirgaceae bacterium]|jgi:thioredoxin reductase (NADPH)
MKSTPIIINNSMATIQTQCLIIGSGPAGYTAAIYASRAGIKPLMFQGSQPGGQLMITNDVENYPGYPDGIMGPEMMIAFQKQAERFGTDVRLGMVTEVNFSKDGGIHTATVENGDVVEAETIIISTGASAKWLGLESEQRLNGQGVSACAVCDGFFYRDMEVAVVGGGDTAAEEATYLAKLCTKVHLFVRRDEMRASNIMQKRVLNTKNIEVHWNTETEEILGKDEVEGVRIKNRETGETKEIKVQGFFVAIGHKPNTDIFKDWLDMDENGYLITAPDSTATKAKGVFAAGDAQDHVWRQAVTAAGTGCMAALEAERYLAAKEVEA